MLYTLPVTSGKISANGTSKIANIAQIDRGYEDIEKRLNKLGAKIRRVDD